MTRILKIWLTARQLAMAESTRLRLLVDLPSSREPWKQAEERLENSRLRVEALRLRLNALEGGTNDRSHAMTVSRR
jgi:hypothetical protein